MRLYGVQGVGERAGDAGAALVRAGIRSTQRTGAWLTPLSGVAVRSTQPLRQELMRAFDAVVPIILDAVLDRVDLTRLVIERVDLDEVARHVDLDAAAGRIDLDAAVHRVDLITLANYIIDGVDLPEIIRASTGSMASEGVRTMRMQTIDADERVNRLVDRVLLRRQGRRTDVPVQRSLNGDAPGIEGHDRDDR